MVLNRVVIGLLAVALLALAADAVHLHRLDALNRRLAAEQPQAGPDDPPELPELRFAHALALAAAQPGGYSDEALNQFRALQGDTPLGQAARFNSANLLLRRALVVRAGPQPGQAIPLIELAKETYRELLRRDPGHWDARYNLERAQRLLPDPEEEGEVAPDAKRDAERAPTTMRGYSPGLP
ncbi:hypothetical protein [Pelomonas sp. KK5]|uniref:hypothetical protein n=1 Tax=Pelomonas sp. KK5 TaxID=1855730 RepID=UPI00097C4A3C|nr:hypothetical protein [Pelomonas sp. KK5]